MRKSFAFLSLIFVSMFVVSCASAPGSGNNPGGGGTSTMAPGVYVATNGNDTSLGTSASTPMLTIQYAISNAIANGLTNIYVAQGLYSNLTGLLSGVNGIWITNSGLSISGGWDSSFTSRSGKSLLEGNQSINHVITVGNASYIVSNIMIDGFAIQGGNSPDSGGGLYLVGAMFVLITNSVLSNNHTSTWGGGACSENSTNIAIFADIISNVAGSYGGGLALNGSVNIVINGNISRNTCAFAGGGVFINNVCSVITQTGLVASNTVTSGKGGGIYCSGNLAVFRADILMNTCTVDGGGIFIESGTVNILTNSLIANNYSGSRGGGVEIDSSYNSVMNCVISNNIANLYGGGIAILGNYNTNLSTVIGNQVTNDTVTVIGGGMYLIGNYCIIEGSVNGNTTPYVSAYGGGVYMGGNYTLFSATVCGNISKNGGGIYVGSGLNSILNSGIYNNSVSNSGYGGGIMIDGASYTTVSNCDITNNSTEDDNGYGGGIYIGGGVENLIIGNMITSNWTGYAGAGMVLNNTTSIRVIQNLIAGNYSDSVGSGVSMYSSRCQFVSNVIVSNSGCSYGALQIEGALAVTNEYNIIMNNFASVWLRNCGSGLLMRYNIIGAMSYQAGNIGIDEGTYGDSSGHTIFGNVFVTNTVQFLYKDYLGAHIVTNDSTWTNINNTFYSGAGIATGNIVTNL